MNGTDFGLNLRWGIARGILLGATFSVVLGASMLIRGRAVYGATTFPRTVAVTTILGFLGGLCVGSLRAFTRSSWGAVAVGSLGGVFAFAAIWIVAFGMDRSLSLPSLLGGALVGARASAMSRESGQASAGKQPTLTVLITLCILAAALLVAWWPMWHCSIGLWVPATPQCYSLWTPPSEQ